MARERIRSSPSAGEESDDPLDVIERPSRPTPVRPSPSVPAPRPSQVRSPVHNDSYAGAKRRKLSSSASESDSSSGSRSERSVSRSPTPVSNRSKTQRRQQDLSSSDVEAESRAGRARVSPVKARASRVVISDDEEEGPALHGSSAHEVPRAGTEGDVGMEPAKPDQPLSHNEADLGDSTVSDAVDAIATDTQEDVASRGSQFEADDGSDLADPAVDEKGDAGERATLIGTENEETPPTSETQLPIAAAEYMQMTATEDVGSRVPQVGQPYADGSFPSPAKKAAELLGDHQHQPTQDILVEGGGGVRDIDPELGPDVPPAGPVSAEQSPEVAVANDNSHQAAPHEMEVDTAESFPAAVTANPNVDPASDRAADAEATVANITIEPALEDAAVSAAFASSSPTPTHLAATPVPDPVAENQLDAATSSAPIVPGISPLEANTNTSTAPSPAAARPATVSISTPTVPPSIEEMNYGFTDTGRPILGYTATGRPILGKAVTTAVTTGDPGLSGGGSPSGSTMASVTGKGESSTAKEKEKARKAKVAALAKEKEAARVQAALEKEKERERERSREVEMGLGREEKEVGRKDQEGKESKGKGKGKKSKVEDLKGKARSTSTSTTSAKASSPSHTASSSPTPTPSATSTPEPTKAPSSNKNKTAADRGSSVVQPPVQVVSEEEEEEDDEIYCSCGKTGREDGNDDLLACDACDHWFHAGCVGMKAGDLERIDSFICQSCEKLTSQRTTFKKACARPACDVSFAGRQSKYCSSTCGLKHARSLIATLPPKSLPELASSLADFPSPPPEVKIIDHAAFPDPYLPSASISPLESDPIAFQPQSTLSTGTVLAALQRQLESIRAQLDTTLKRQSLVQGLLERCDALPPLSATAPPVPASAEEIRKKDKNKSKSKTKGASASGGGSDDRPCGWISVVLWDDEDINGWDGEMPAVPDLPPVGAGLDEQTDGGGDVDEQGAAAAGKGEARMREIRAIRDSMGDWDWCDRPRKRCDRHNGWQKTAPLLLEREAEDLSGRVDLLEAQLEASRQAQEAEQRGKDARDALYEKLALHLARKL